VALQTWVGKVHSFSVYLGPESEHQIEPLLSWAIRKPVVFTSKLYLIPVRSTCWLFGLFGKLQR